MTDESDFDWKSVFDERGYDAEPVEGPVDRDEDDAAGLEWFQVLTRFTQRGFMRAIAADAAQKVKVELQIALPGGDDAGYLDALTAYLRKSGLSLDVVSRDRPWTLDLVVDSRDALSSLIDDLEVLSAHVRRAEESEDIGALADDWRGAGTGESAKEQVSPRESEGAAPSPSEEPESTPDGGSPDAESPFESIGDEEADEDAVPPSEEEQAEEAPPEKEPSGSGGRARLGAFSLRVADAGIVLRAEADRSVDEPRLERLARSLRSKLENRFDLVARSTDIATGEDEVLLKMEPSELGATYGMPLGELCDDVARYLDRQRELAHLGVSLDKVTAPEKPARKPRRDRTTRRPEVSEPRRQQSPAPADDADSGVVFGFDEGDIAAASPSESTLDPGDYSDSRVMREDATTALVDVVLRHPGYSDRNMRQVLSILLDIDYYRAGKLIDQAPCVIAWGVSQERAREFKRVIENSGGRVTLVEPDTLAEAE